MPLVFSGYTENHHGRLLALLNKGLATGTWRNKNGQLQKYLQYMEQHNSDPVRPSQYHVLSYIMHLADTLSSPGAIFNYISGARSWVRMLEGDTAPFDSYQATLLKRGIQRSTTHEPAQAPPLTPDDIKTIIKYLRSAGPNGSVIVSAILLAYFTLLRQSNLFASASGDGAEHVLSVRDITVTSAGLNVRVHSTKTRWSSSQPTDIAVPAIMGSPYCPVRAWSDYVHQVRPNSLGYAFVTTAGMPVRAAAVKAVIQLALTEAGHPHPRAFTLHSLRRGGAQACAQQGARLADIQDLGTWNSHAVHSYVPRAAITSAPRTLSSIFA